MTKRPYVGEARVRYKNDLPSPTGESWYDYYAEHGSKVTCNDFDHNKVLRNQLPEFKRTDPVSKSQKSYIRRLLGLPSRGRFPRCVAKVGKVVKRCEDNGDYSHSSKEHAPCNICRCKKIAGFGTKGNFYGIGPNTGHYGCGYCRDHEHRANFPQNAYMIIARNHADSLKLDGEKLVNYENYQEQASEEALAASRRVAAREEFDLVVDAIGELKEKLIPETDLRAVQALERIAEALENVDNVDPLQVAGVQALLESKMLERTSLTEYVSGKIKPWSSKTRLELISKMALTVSRLKLDDFKLDSACYIHKDEFIRIFGQYMPLFERALNLYREKQAAYKEGDQNPFEVVKDWFAGEHKKLFNTLKVGAKR